MSNGHCIYLAFIITAIDTVTVFSAFLSYGIVGIFTVTARVRLCFLNILLYCKGNDISLQLGLGTIGNLRYNRLAWQKGPYPWKPSNREG